MLAKSRAAYQRGCPRRHTHPRLPAAVLLPGVTMISFVGIYSLSGSYFDLLLMIGFGGLGYVLRKLSIPAVPVILGILLGGWLLLLLLLFLVSYITIIIIFFTRFCFYVLFFF